MYRMIHQNEKGYMKKGKEKKNVLESNIDYFALRTAKTHLIGGH